MAQPRAQTLYQKATPTIYHVPKKKTKVNHEIYKNYRNLLNQILKRSERLHYQSLIIQNQNNLRKTWQVIKEVINKKKTPNQKTTIFSINGNSTTDSSIIASHFNKFFANIGPTLDSKIPPSSRTPSSYIKTSCPVNLFLSPCHLDEINRTIDNLKNCATGWDHLPSSLLKENKHIFNPLLVHLINLSLIQGTFPSELKIANIIPIFKAGEIGQVTNYRPISLLTSISKIYERIFSNRLTSFLKTQKILYDLQFGFRDKHSTYLAMITLMDKLIQALERGEYTIGIFLDFSKAFDTVNHRILLDKLNLYGIRGVANKWVESYLSNRKQFTSYNGSNSSINNVKCGVPQGSILGPILFLLYINDLGTISNLLSPIMFADDSNLFISGKKPQDLANSLNQELPLLIEWLRANRLSLNVDKTHVMIFGKKNTTTQIPIKIQIDGKTLSVLDKTKFLGVILDSGLNWKDHINYLAKKISRSIGIISIARKTLSQKTLIQLYHAFIFPYLNYCVLIWGNSPASILWPVFKLQKLALRLIANIGYRDSSLAFCKKHQILRLPEIYALNAGIFMYKYSYHQLPPLFNSLFTANQDIHHYATRNAQMLRVPIVKTRIADKFITKTGVNLWNNFKSVLSTNCKLGTFKKKLKIHLTHNYFT